MGNVAFGAAQSPARMIQNPHPFSGRLLGGMPDIGDVVCAPASERESDSH